jgi:hypothetical protein
VGMAQGAGRRGQGAERRARSAGRGGQGAEGVAQGDIAQWI